MHAKSRGAVLHVMTLKAYLTTSAIHCILYFAAAKFRLALCEELRHWQHVTVVRLHGMMSFEVLLLCCGSS